MKTEHSILGDTYTEEVDRVDYDFGLDRRSFVQILSTGLLIIANASPALAQRRNGGGRHGPRCGY